MTKDYEFEDFDSIRQFLRGEQVRQPGRVYIDGPPLQMVSKAMYEAGKVLGEQEKTGFKGATAVGAGGAAIAIGVVAIPVAVPAFLAALAGAEYFKRKAAKRTDEFRRAFPFGSEALTFIENGWKVTVSDEECIILRKYS